jgi:hypothetical protein
MSHFCSQNTEKVEIYCKNKQTKIHNYLGYFIGDGAGVGKGRQLAAIIFENWTCGRKKHIWLSVASDLRHDARRDMVKRIIFDMSRT